MIFSIKKEERFIFDLIKAEAEASNVPAYVVGGYVRDRLLGRPCKDMDIVCVGDGMQMAENVAKRLSPVPKVVVYPRFGTAMMRYNDLEIEFVGARKESYHYESRNPDVVSGTFEDDQSRRDFTINALAVCLNEACYGQIVDSFGGLNHLEQKLIKTPLDPDMTFSDDPLRMLRAIRFSNQLDFEIEASVLDSITRNASRVNIISKERITTELEKILQCEKPSKGFLLLFKTGLLKYILPELVDLQGVETVQGKGHKDNFYHTLQVVDNLAQKSNNIWLRWAALLHDIAKPATKKYDANLGWTFHGHEYLGANLIPKVFKKLRLPLDHKMKYVQKMVLLHLRPISLTKEEVTASALRRLIVDAEADLEDLLLLCEADITSKNPQKVKRYLEGYVEIRNRINEVKEADRIRLWQPPINGEIIMQTFGIPSGKEVGIIKNNIREAIIEGLIENDYDAAFQFMLEEGKKLGLEQVSL